METQKTYNWRRHWWRKALFIPVAIAAGVFLFGSVVMLLWNALLPSIFGIGTITFWQALGILALAKILFGGFRGGWRGRPRHMYHWRHKWMNMSEEERARFREEWGRRCGNVEEKSPEKA